MFETADELAWLQGVLDRSYEQAGDHLRSIHTAAARLDADALTRRMPGMNVLVVATVTADGRPLTGPVDSFFFHGRFHFGTSPLAFRTRHLQRRPFLSATHVRGEELVVTVHGRARTLDLTGADAAFTELTRDHYGRGWDEWDEPPAAWAIEPHRLFAADMSVHASTGGASA